MGWREGKKNRSLTGGRRGRDRDYGWTRHALEWLGEAVRSRAKRWASFVAAGLLQELDVDDAEGSFAGVFDAVGVGRLGAGSEGYVARDGL